MRKVRIVQPCSLLAGRRFEPQAERSLHSLAEEVASTLPGISQEALLLPEMPSPLGLPDFVALIGGSEWIHARNDIDIPPITSENDCILLAALYIRKSLSISTISQKISWNLDDVRFSVERLCDIGAIYSTGRDAYRINAALVPDGSIFALEAKIKNWQKAIFQGRAYRTWADNYVILLGGVGDQAAQRAKERVESDKAGLFLSSGWLVRPHRRKPANSQRFRGFEYLYAAITS